MRVAIVHYHLRPGGVTRVIENSLLALDKKTGFVPIVLCGEDPDPKPNFNYRVVDGLGYADHNQPSQITSLELAKRMRVAASEGLEGHPPDLWHIHNHSLGKNHLFHGAVLELAQAKESLLLHIHDFAEDGRPKNYLNLLSGLGEQSPSSSPYLTASHIHYAALNGRDLSILQQAGIPAEHLHLLPNPITGPSSTTSDFQGPEEPAFLNQFSEVTLYPARGIRRKNLGEFVLWSTQCSEGALLAMSLAPANPAEQPFHQRWVDYSRENSLPCLFGASQHAPFSAWIQKAERFITTSMAEGFGLAFLEPWLHGKPLIGRDLPQITTDFSNKGIKLDSLYHRLLVPLDTFDHPSLRNKVSSKLSESYQSYRVEIDPNAVDQAIASNLEADRIDFGFLDEDHQQQVISRAIDSPQLQSEIFEALDHKGPSPEIIETNRDIVAQNYSLDGYGHRLDSLYQTMLSETAGPVDAINKHAILEQFLSPARFTLLRS